MPRAAVRHGRARQSSGTGPCGDCRKIPCERALGISVRRKFVLSRNPGYKTRGRHVAKRSSDPRVGYPEVKVHVRDLVRVLGVVAPFAPRVSIRENLFYRAPGAKWAQETCAGCPQERYATGEPGKVQGWDPVGIIEWSYGNRARGVSIRGKFVLFTKLGYRTRGCHHVAKRSSDSRVAYPEVNVQVRDLVRVVGIVAPFAPRGVSIWGKFVVLDLKRGTGDLCWVP